jgi:hypothetical protein
VLQSPTVTGPSVALPDAGAAPSDDEGFDAGTPTPSDAGVADPCQGYPPEGACVAPNSLYRCVVPTGNGTPVLSQEDCGVTRHCVASDGQASCELLPGACTPGDSECKDADTRRTCDESGAWQETECPQSCATSALGAACVSVATATYSGTLAYEARGPNQGLTDWATAPAELPARGVLVVSLRDGEIVDSATTDAQGEFELQIPETPQAGDTLYAMLVRPAPGGNGVAFAVMQPDVPDGQANATDAGAGSEPQQWFWSIDPSAAPSGSRLVITEALGSGALRVFENLRAAYDLTAEHYGAQGKRVVVWLRMNTAWDCGACFFDLPVNAGGLAFDAQIVLPALAGDTSYWADPVTSHELGHWVMSAFGRSPGEGGPHCVSDPTFPGQAWSEGWATGFSSVIRNDSIYYDKQAGTFFWIDLGTRTYWFDENFWQRASPEDGLLQLMDEFEVSAMLWDLHANHDVSTGTLLDALASSRMTTSPFQRGYTRHRWDVVADPQGGCVQTNVIEESTSQPMFADYLDALACDGLSESTLDAVTEPQSFYPYPSQAPLCVGP